MIILTQTKTPESEMFCTALCTSFAVDVTRITEIHPYSGFMFLDILCCEGNIIPENITFVFDVEYI